MNQILKSIRNIILFGLLYFLLKRYADVFTASIKITISYALAFIFFVSVIHGPIIGAGAAALGTLIYQTVTNTFDWMIISCMAADCIFIGFFMSYLNIREGFFEKKDAVNFNNFQLLSHTICWIIFYPLLVYFILQEPLLETMMNGFFEVLGYYISCLIITTLLLDIYAQTRISEANFYRK